MIFGTRKRKKTIELSPDEIFLDSKNLPGFDRNQMEGRLAMLVSKRVAFFVLLFFAGVALVIAGQLWSLQIRQGQALKERAFFNSFEKVALSPERGIIYDRNGSELAWNEARFRIVLDRKHAHLLQNAPDILLEKFFPQFSFDVFKNTQDPIVNIIDDISWEDAEQSIEAFPSIPFRVEASSVRTYTNKGGFSHLLGYTGLSSEDIRDNMKLGKTGVEKYYDAMLRGTGGVRFIETDARGTIVSESLQEEAKNGDDLTLTIDMDVQSALYHSLGKVIEERGFLGGAGILFNVKTGEILAMTSFPEFDLNEFSHGISQESFSRLTQNKRAPFFFRAMEGTYLPGSVFKPIVALAALDNEIISPTKEIFSSGRITVPNPFFPDRASIFLDWKAHGWVDMRRALAVSSNVYFYSIGGGYENQKGVGALEIERYARLFGFGVPVFDGIYDASGVVPHPEKIENWRVGDTYNFSIGQGELQVTPIQMARFLGMLANKGIPPPFHIAELNQKTEALVRTNSIAPANLPQEYFDIVKEGMRLAVKEGTAQAFAGFSVPFAGKTGTAEIGRGRVNSWFMAYGPFDDPEIGIVVVLENGDEKNLIGAASAASEFMRVVISTHPEYVTGEKMVSASSTY